MSEVNVINTILAGGLLGVLGQGIRIAVGLKKLSDGNTANAAQGKPSEEFSTSRMLISIFIGFVAGSISLIIKEPGDADKLVLGKEGILMIMAAGYSGADFIEGVFNTYINKLTPTNQTQQAQQESRSTNLEEQPVG